MRSRWDGGARRRRSWRRGSSPAFPACRVCWKFGFLEHVRETRFPVPKFDLSVTRRLLVHCRTSHFSQTRAPKLIEFAPDRKVPKIPDLLATASLRSRSCGCRENGRQKKSAVQLTPIEKWTTEIAVQLKDTASWTGGTATAVHRAENPSWRRSRKRCCSIVRLVVHQQISSFQ